MQKLSKPIVSLLMIVGLALSLAVFAAARDHQPDHKDASLYNRLGGRKAITAVVDEFVKNCATDDRINSFFKDTAADPKRLASFKMKLVDQICEASGGPCKYKGKNMKDAHRNMGVKDEHFNALVENLVRALDKFQVGEKEKNELLGALGPMKGDIVE